MPVDDPSSAPNPAPHRTRGVYASGEIIAGKYELLTPVAEGGMGSVWLTLNHDLDVEVAVKLIRRELAGSDDAAQRLLNEAQATASLDHPSIVTIHDFGETPRGDPYIVMEMLQGETLEETLEREEHLPVTYAVRVLLPILDALQLAHTKGIVHRDLKPANIFLVENEAGDTIPKLVDFGVAKLCYRDTMVPAEQCLETSATHVRRVAQSITKTGTVLGSPQYMAPEQVRADPCIDGRADLWAVCVVLYDAIVGERPFDDDDLEELLRSILRDAPTPVTALGVDEPELWEILGRGLQKDADDRWPDARALGEALAGWLVDKGVHTDITGRSVYTKWLSHTLAPSPVEPPPQAARLPRAPHISRVGAAILASAVTASTIAVALTRADPEAPTAPPSHPGDSPRSSPSALSPPVGPAAVAGRGDEAAARGAPMPSAAPRAEGDRELDEAAGAPPRPAARTQARPRRRGGIPMPEVWDF